MITVRFRINILFLLSNIYSISDQPTYRVKLKENLSDLTLPDEFVLRLAYESLDILDLKTHLPLLQFPYQSIICWGSSVELFQFNAFPPIVGVEKEKETIKISVLTNCGKGIDAMIMKQIKALMADIATTAVSKEEFIALKKELFTKDELVVCCSLVHYQIVFEYRTKYRRIG